MTLASSSGDKEFVRVICDHTYTPKDAKDPVSIKIGEAYWLIDKTDAAWWFVQNIESRTQFFIPANYVEIPKDGHGDVGIPASGTLTKGKTPAPKPKPRTSKTSSSDDVTPGVMTPSDEKAKQCLTRTVSSGENTPQAVMPRMSRVSYENVEIPTDGSLTRQKASPGHETKSRLSKMSSEDEALKQLDAVLQAEDEQQVKLMIEEQHTDQMMAEEGDIKTDKDTDQRTQEQTVKFCAHESFDDSKTTVPSNQEADMAVKKLSPAVVRKAEQLPEVSLSSSSSSSVLASQPASAEIEEDDIDYVNLPGYQQTVKETEATTAVSPSKRAESETSDYRSGDSRGGSRESLESKSCDTDSIGTKEDLEKPDTAVQVDSRPIQELPPRTVPNKSVGIPQVFILTVPLKKVTFHEVNIFGNLII